jgi:hypothetical protein
MSIEPILYYLRKSIKVKCNVCGKLKQRKVSVEQEYSKTLPRDVINEIKAKTAERLEQMIDNKIKEGIICNACAAEKNNAN